MTVAIISPEPNAVAFTVSGSADLPAFTYVINVRVSASDGVTIRQGDPLTVSIPHDTKRSQFNDLIIQAAIDLMATHGLVVDSRDIFFQPFDNG